MISKDNAYSLIKNSGTLPTLPAILLKLLEACDNDETPLSEIAAIINKDPILSCKVLQLVNSAYYGFRYCFKGIEQAVVYLGANTIKNIAVTMSIHQVFDQKCFESVSRFNINVFWYHSLMRATLAKRIAQKISFNNFDEAYLSGLLLDIGKLILISTFPKEHESIHAETTHKASTKNKLWAETQLLGVSHCEIGSWLMQKWKLNSMMADAIRYHHEPLEKIKEAFPLVRIAYIANLLNEKIDEPESIHEIDDLLLGLHHTDIKEIIEGAAEEVELIAANLEIMIQKPSDSTDPAKPVSVDNAENQETAPGLNSGKQSPRDETDDQETALQDALRVRIKSASLMSTFLENLVKAEDIEMIIAACEQSMSILFNIPKVLFFLMDKNNVFLKGLTSSTNNLHQTSRGLSLPLRRSSSFIVKTYHEMSMAYLTNEESMENLADQQILSVLRCTKVLLVPLIANGKPAGIILLGLPQDIRSVTASDRELIQVVARQVGLCLQLERMKEQKQNDLDAERMAAVSMTARKVAHEINNPLGIISNYIASMKLRLSDDQLINNELTIIDEEIQRISSMIGQLDMFSQDAVYHYELTDVNATIADIIQLVKSARFAGSGINFSFLPDSNTPLITTSKDGIKQILINLLKNAAEAMNNGGDITVTTRQATPKMDTEGEGLKIVVADTGPGLPEVITTNLYTPFVTTKQNGHSGLGLSIVHKTITDLGGRLSCTSSPGNGTSFTIFLPSSHEYELRQTKT
jgi:HD-like signal output (HDOD) protein/signal transduction histidine kinase